MHDLAEGQDHHEDFGEEDMEDDDVIVGPVEDGPRIGEGKTRQDTEIPGEIGLRHHKAIRGPGVAPGNQVAQEEGEEEEEKEEVVGGHRDLPVLASETPEEEVEGGNRHGEANEASSYHVA